MFDVDSKIWERLTVMLACIGLVTAGVAAGKVNNAKHHSNVEFILADR